MIRDLIGDIKQNNVIKKRPTVGKVGQFGLEYTRRFASRVFLRFNTPTFKVEFIKEMIYLSLDDLLRQLIQYKIDETQFQVPDCV